MASLTDLETQMDAADRAVLFIIFVNIDKQSGELCVEHLLLEAQARPLLNDMIEKFLEGDIPLR